MQKQENMKILVTGATGFIGSQLNKYLNMKGHLVHGLSSHNSRIENIVCINLSDLNKLNSYFKKNKYDVVIHLAATIDNKNPIQIFESNCQNTINLLESCRLHKIKKFIFASTHAVYGNSKYLPIDEEHQVMPITNYAISKLIAENVCKMFHHSYGIDTLILRISSVYGKDQTPEHLIPTLIRNCLYDKKMLLHKYLNGFQQMDLIHVQDVCKAIELACRSTKSFGTYNIATGKPITVKEISKILSKIMGIQNIKTKKITQQTNHFFYDTYSALKDLKFKAKIMLDEKTLNPIIAGISKK